MQLAAKFRLVIGLLSGAMAFTCAPGPTEAQCPDTHVTLGEIRPIEGKPFEATEVFKQITYLPDQTKKVSVTKSNLFRDGKGRVRAERFQDGTDDPSVVIPTVISLDDNCGTYVELYPSKHLAITLQTHNPRPLAEAPGLDCAYYESRARSKLGPTSRFEDLGKKMVGDVTAHGWRTSTYKSPEGRLLGSIDFVELWCSEQIANITESHVMSVNPRQENHMVISDVMLVEPDAGLFEIPSDYVIQNVDRSDATPSNSPKTMNSSKP